MHRGRGWSPVENAKWKLARPPYEVGMAQVGCGDALGTGAGSAMAMAMATSQRRVVGA